MKHLCFLVQGSAPKPYRVTFQKNGNNLSAYCDCSAGQNGQYCKHRINILGGISAGIVSDNEGDVKTITSWVSGTDVEEMLNNVTAAEEKFEMAKTELSLAKKKLAIALRD